MAADQQPRPQSNLSAGQFVALLISMGLAFYLMYHYIGPYRWIAELQLRWIGSYSEKLTLIFTVLPIWVVILAVTWPLRRGFVGRRMAPRPQTFASVIVIIIGLGFVFLGLRKVQSAQSSGKLAFFQRESLEGGQAPPSSWVHIRGVPLVRASAEFGRGSSKDEFVPVVSSVRGGLPVPGVRLFLKFGRQAGYTIDPGPAEYEGTLEAADLPGPVRVAMERNGLLKSADYYVLEVGQTPAGKLREGRITTEVGLGAIGLGIVIGIVGRLRRHAAPQAVTT